jgi:microcystin degradation protein MlrC
MPRMPHLFIAGFQHETNTFAPSRADWAAFTAATTFPSVERGALHTLMERNLPISGFMRAARAAGWTWVEGVYRGATPSAHITRDTFERIAAEIVEHAAAVAGEIDAIYLDLHGAAVAEHIEDCEGELLARLRAALTAKGKADLPIVASLDLHGNISDAMFAHADGLVAYRKYPHTDMADTGGLAQAMLAKRLKLGRRQSLAVARSSYLIPINAQTTWMEPAKSVYETLVALDAPHRADASLMLSFCPGFPASDIAECAPCWWAYADDESTAQTALQALSRAIDQPAQWRLDFLSADEAVASALELLANGAPRVVIADTQDNPGAGGDGNTTGMLHALLRAKAGERYPGQVALALLCDPRAAQAAHAGYRGEGANASVHLSLGQSVPTFGSTMSDAPVVADFSVVGVSEGRCELKGVMSTHAVADLGLSCALETQGVLVAVSSKKKQALDRALFSFVGIDALNMRLLVVKSSAHFRADFSPLVTDPSAHILVAKAAGPMAADPRDLPWTKLPKSLRAWP